MLSTGPLAFCQYEASSWHTVHIVGSIALTALHATLTNNHLSDSPRLFVASQLFVICHHAQPLSPSTMHEAFSDWRDVFVSLRGRSSLH